MTVKVRLPASAKCGSKKHRVTVTYAGNGQVSKATVLENLRIC